MQFRSFCLARRGSRPEECDDACAANHPLGRFAVADGAAGSVFARSWAQWLVQQYVASSDTEIDAWIGRLPKVQEEWAAQFRGRELPWYAEVKLQQGAFATLLGLNVKDFPGLACQWHAWAVGDSCLFHTRGGKLLKSFPVEQSGRFNNSPALLGSKTPSEEIQRRSVTIHGSGVPNDRLWLMTDSLAQWCLAEHESARCPWTEMEECLSASANEEPFSSWIEGLRDRRGLRNDDVTLMAIRF